MDVCSVWDCNKPKKTKGYCANHYAQYWRTGNVNKTIDGNKRKHPFYALWFERKQANMLCEEWLDFKCFVEGVSPKPEGNYFLIRLRKEPFGPNNFKWQEHLKRKKGESKKDWYARKWAARQIQNPGMERARNFQRKYGLTIDQYNEKLKNQNEVCAICGEKETSVDPKTSGARRLAVDHCHDTNKIRSLLCWRCNATIGKVKEDVELLKKMIAYLEFHNVSKSRVRLAAYP